MSHTNMSTSEGPEGQVWRRVMAGYIQRAVSPNIAEFSEPSSILDTEYSIIPFARQFIAHRASPRVHSPLDDLNHKLFNSLTNRLAHLVVFCISSYSTFVFRNEALISPRRRNTETVAFPDRESAPALDGDPVGFDLAEIPPDSTSESAVFCRG